MYNRYIPYANRMDEIGSCNLRAAAEGSVIGGNRLRLFSFSCFDLSLEIDSGLIGPVKPVISARWIDNSVFVSFYGSPGEVARLEQTAGSFSYSGSAFHQANIFSLYQYGGSHLIGLGLKNVGFGSPHLTVNLYSKFVLN